MTRPNQLTILRIALTPVFAFMVLLEGITSKYVACGVFLIASLTDLYDGYVARKYGSTSKWGKFLDPLADKILITTALVCLAVLEYVALWMVLVIAVRDVIITGLRSYAFWKGRPVITMSLARWKTASQALVVYLALAYMLAELSVAQGGIRWSLVEWVAEVGLIDKLMLLVTFITVLTGVVYLFDNRHHLKSLVADVCRAISPTDASG